MADAQTKQVASLPATARRTVDEDPPATVQMVRTDYGGQIAVHDFGGDPKLGHVVLLPANGFHGLCYKALAGHLRSQLHCYAIDAPDQGSSGPAPPDGNFYDHYITAVRAFLDHFALPGCHVFGHSSGGLTAAALELRAPGSFSSLYLYEPVLFAPLITDWYQKHGKGLEHPGAKLAVRRRVTFASKAAALTNYARKPPFHYFRADVLLNYVQHGFAPTSGAHGSTDGTVSLRCSPQAESRVYNEAISISIDVWPHISSIRTHTTVACGTDDPKNTFAEAEKNAPWLVEGIALARLEKYSHVRHLGPMEDPAFIAGRLLKHIQASGDQARWQGLSRRQEVQLSKL
ncbi:hypothetical protein WJX73_007646 [Symbiochloris irregularis]|uniref:AB hydrolase-1 domain-containing protein n=1 Tax=Symbiochloris irregularis TaxID=706552 RepID=A0AAW1NZR7_9CHLO